MTNPVNNLIHGPDTLSVQDLSSMLGLIFGRENLGLHVRRITADYEMLPRDSVVIIDATAGPISVYLPQANVQRTDRSPVLLFKRIDATGNSVSFLPLGSDTVEGGASLAIAASFGQILVSNGVNAWWALI